MAEDFTYKDAVAALQRALRFGMDPSLGPITAMCAQLGNPQDAYACVQVAGSNGKSSTSRMVAGLLAAHGKKTGLYTSPHLVKYPERIEVDGQVVGDGLFAQGIARALAAAEAAGVVATEFELLTAAALWVFAQEGVQVAVLECGLGGRWDATTVADAQVAVITGIALEHTDVLGDTLEQIAAEKAAIIKPGATAVLADGLAAREVFEQRAAQVGATVVHAQLQAADAYAEALALKPAYQRMNASTALAAAEVALGHPLDASRAALALRAVAVPGRFEVLRAEPLLMVDAAHNPQSAQVLAVELARVFVPAGLEPREREARLAAGKPPIPALLLGVLADKDVRGVVEALVPLFPQVVVTASSSPRAISPERLAGIVEEVTGTRPSQAPSVRSALQLLEGTPTLATGSITIAGEVKRVFGARIG